jgi:hypothetical protein
MFAQHPGNIRRPLGYGFEDDFMPVMFNDFDPMAGMQLQQTPDILRNGDLSF